MSPGVSPDLFWNIPFSPGSRIKCFSISWEEKRIWRPLIALSGARQLWEGNCVQKSCQAALRLVSFPWSCPAPAPKLLLHLHYNCYLTWSIFSCTYRSHSLRNQQWPSCSLASEKHRDRLPSEEHQKWRFLMYSLDQAQKEFHLFFPFTMTNSPIPWHVLFQWLTHHSAVPGSRLPPQVAHARTPH